MKWQISMEKEVEKKKFILISLLSYQPAPSEVKRKFQQDTRAEIPQDLLY